MDANLGDSEKKWATAPKKSGQQRQKVREEVCSAVQNRYSKWLLKFVEQVQNGAD